MATKDFLRNAFLLEKGFSLLAITKGSEFASGKRMVVVCLPSFFCVTLWHDITFRANSISQSRKAQIEGFAKLCDAHAVDMIHPDLATSGGLLETKKIGDYAEERGVAMAMHFAGSPVSCMANVHCAAATRNFLALEIHSTEVPFWDDLVNGISKPIVQKGYIPVPDAPGLGVTLNDEVCRQHLLEPGYFEPTTQWDKEQP